MSEAVLKNDPAPLVDAIRRSVALKIDEINSTADAEIKKTENEVLGEIENLRQEEERRYSELTAYEESKAANLLSIELKKLKLDIIEEFTGRIISELTAVIRIDSRYVGFLKQCAVSPLRDIAGGSVTVHISPSDAAFTDAIKEAVCNVRCNLKIRVIEDESIESGGVMVIDDDMEIVFNNTIERILYRKSDGVRRIIVRSLDELTDGDR